MHGARQPGDAFVPDIAADRLGDHFDTLDCTLLATGLDSGDLCVERAGIRAETRIIRLPADRLMRLGRDIAVGEELGGIIRAWASSRTILPVCSSMTRLRIELTISSLCVAITIVVPVRLMRPAPP